MAQHNSTLQDPGRVAAPFAPAGTGKLASTSATRPAIRTWPRAAWHLMLAGLTLATLLIQGYHPLAEDGGIYVAGVEYTLDPSLFPQDTVFVREHLRFSLFAPLLAPLVRFLHLSLAWALLAVELAGLWLTFYAARELLRRCFLSDAVQAAGLGLLSVWATLPVAGTSLLVTDPYVTARSLSTPLSLWAIALALDVANSYASAMADGSSSNMHPRSRGFRESPVRPDAFSRPRAQKGFAARFRRLGTWRPWPVRQDGSRSSMWGCLLCLALAALLHPLMAAYAAVMVLSVWAACSPWPRLAWSVLTSLAVLLAGSICALAPAESAAVLAASYSRYYWFLSQWRWFELLGLIGPLVVLLGLGAIAGNLQSGESVPRQKVSGVVTLCRASLGVGITAILVALLFAREHAHTHLVARLQPLRVFLLIYAIMILLLGASLAQAAHNLRARLQGADAREQLRSRRTAVASPRAAGLLRSVLHSVRNWPAGFAPALVSAALLLTLGSVSFYVQRQTFPRSPHLELPWQAAGNSNPWTQAFLWARATTPRDALFALDASYISEPGEDAQTFRATALRSAVPDYSKDGGEASITPALAELWQQGAEAQLKLSAEPDSVREARLRPLGVTWMVLHSSALTRHPCPYNNGTVKICRLQP